MQTLSSHLTRLLATAAFTAIAALSWHAESIASAKPNSPSLLRILRESAFYEKRYTGPADELIVSIRKAVAEGANLYEVDEDGNGPFELVVFWATVNVDRVDEATKVVRVMIELGRDVNRPWIVSGQGIAPICLPLIYATWNTALVELMFKAGVDPSSRCEGKSLEDSVGPEQRTSQRLVEIVRRYR